MGAAEAKQAILDNRTALGIEFGSTRIKAVLVDGNNAPIASGGHEWENRYENGVWTYSLEDIWSGLQDCYQQMAKDVEEKYGVELTSVGAIGISAMMHGYMPFDKEEIFWFRSEPGEIILRERQAENCPNFFSIIFLRDGVSHICIRQF